MPKQRLYFDYAASTPVSVKAAAAMVPYFSEEFGNAGSLHSFGQKAMASLDTSRETIAKAINAGFREIVFTGSATEANNLALRGAVKKFKRDFPKAKPRVIISAVEHESVLETARDMENEADVVIIPVSEKGIVDTEKLKAALNGRTAVVSVMYANNETGTVQPVEKISEIVSAARYGKKKEWPLFHTDAVQAFQFLGCDVKKLGADMMTLSAHKIYGPKGIGALYMRNADGRSFPVAAVTTGGGQEFGVRSGTENVPLAAGFAAAAEETVRLREKEYKRVETLRDSLWKGIKKAYPKAKRNGDEKNVLPNFLNVYFPDFDAEDLLTRFDLEGIAVSAGSACSARSSQPSYVLEAMRPGGKQSGRSIRITLGRPTSKRDVDTLLKIIGKLTK